MLFPTTIAGSLPKPEWLAEPNTLLGAVGNFRALNLVNAKARCDAAGRQDPGRRRH